MKRRTATNDRIGHKVEPIDRIATALEEIAATLARIHDEQARARNRPSYGVTRGVGEMPPDALVP